MFVIALALSTCLLQSAVGATSSDSLHWAAWDSSLAWSGSVRAIPYSFYAYRSLAVPHPEVYLQADLLLSEVIESLPGGRTAFVSGDARDLKLHLRMARHELRGPSFDWGEWRCDPDSVSDRDMPDSAVRVSWLDRRLPSSVVLLRAASHSFSSAEAAAMHYTRVRRAGREERGLYVIVDVTGHGYLAFDSVLYDGGVAERPIEKPESIRPVLVFNERRVYYPLFGRDDRPRDSALARLVRRLGPATSPNGLPPDSSRMARLLEAAALRSESALRLAVLVAAGLVDINEPRARAAWIDYLGKSDSTALDGAASIVQEANFWADRLSPPTAQMAAMIRPDSLSVSLPAVQRQYMALCGRQIGLTETGLPDYEAWGVLWSYGLLESVFDDMVRTRAGSGLSQGTAMSAILDLAGVPHAGVLVFGGRDEVPDQGWVLAGGGRFQFNLGVWTEFHDDVAPIRRPAVILGGYSKPGVFLRFVPGGYCADLDELSVAADVSRLGVTLSRAMPVFRLRPGQDVSLGDLTVSLADGRMTARPLPWPRR
ncbi:MAG: hypothetical protein AB1792_11550 [Candidatus Zixiibacteriota bacterium]